MNDFTKNSGIWLVYDGQCPICTVYCKYVRIKKTVGQLHLVDARTPNPWMDRITQAGLDIDQGMALFVNDNLYYGADAIHMLTLLSTSSGIFNRVNYCLFRSRFGAAVFYPIAKFFRLLILKILGIGYINNLKK